LTRYSEVSLFKSFPKEPPSFIPHSQFGPADRLETLQSAPGYGINHPQKPSLRLPFYNRLGPI
jgi:hypothetical protein